jgi:hypothetical protein
MKDKVIDPSEILIDSEGTIHEKPQIANPWARFLARMFDYSLFFLLLQGIKHLIHGQAVIEPLDSWIPLEYILWVPLEALFLWALKTTPGKWWFRISIRQGRFDRLDYVTALNRSFRVWVRGIGFGIPMINGLCMMVAYHRLKAFKITSWDREDNIQVSHLPLSQPRMAIGATIAILGMVSYRFL